MADGDRILHVHSHLAFDDIWGCTRASTGTIQPDLNGHPIVFGNSGKAREDELNVRGGRNLDADGGTAVDHTDRVDEGLDVLNGIAVMERKGRDEARSLGHPSKP